MAYYHTGPPNQSFFFLTIILSPMDGISLKFTSVLRQLSEYFWQCSVPNCGRWRMEFIGELPNGEILSVSNAHHFLPFTCHFWSCIRNQIQGLSYWNSIILHFKFVFQTKFDKSFSKCCLFSFRNKRPFGDSLYWFLNFLQRV